MAALLSMSSQTHQADPCAKLPQVFRDPLVVLKLAREVGHGKAVPPAANDGIAVRNDLVLAIKRVNVADCALNVDAAIPSGFVTVPTGTALKFHVKMTPFQQPLPGAAVYAGVRGRFGG